MQSKFGGGGGGDGIKLGFYDTDSLACQIADPNDNYFEKLQQLPFLDFSEINPMSKYYSNEHAAKQGFWKVVLLDAIEIVSCRAKAYSVKIFCPLCSSTADPDCVCSYRKTCSGVPKHAKNRLTHEIYKQSLFDNKPQEVEGNVVQAKDHKVRIVAKKYTAFGNLNATRILLPDKINTLPFGAAWLLPIPDLIPIHNGSFQSRPE